MSDLVAIIYDIETGPLPDDRLLEISPFDPSEVGTRATKPESIAKAVAKAREEHLPGLRDKAALDPVIGQVLMIGYAEVYEDPISGEYTTKEYPEVVGNSIDEAWLLDSFWGKVRHGVKMIGHYSNSFDLPFIFGRSVIHDVRTPVIKKGRWLSEQFVDTKDEFFLNTYGKNVKLGNLATALGFDGKIGDGKNFYELFENDRDAAIAYGMRDVEITYKIAKRMRIF